MNQLEPRSDWHLTQDEDYLRLCLDRLNQEPLKWVTQVVALIEQHGRRRDHSDRSMSVNDVGCNVGHLPKGLSEAGLSCDYLGLDVSETYLRHAREAFPGHAFALHDISSSAPRETDISVCSAVLEHILRWEDALENVLQSTRSTAYVRTFFGPQYERSAYVKGQSVPYWIQQFSIVQFGELCSQRGFTMRIVRDSATDSMPQYLGCGVTLCGDCTQNGVVDVLDALVAAQHSAGLLTLTGVGFSNCNVLGPLEPDPAAGVSVLDALAIARFVVGLPITLACC